MNMGKLDKSLNRHAMIDLGEGDDPLIGREIRKVLARLGTMTARAILHDDRIDRLVIFIFSRSGLQPCNHLVHFRRADLVAHLAPQHQLKPRSASVSVIRYGDILCRNAGLSIESGVSHVQITQRHAIA